MRGRAQPPFKSTIGRTDHHSNQQEEQTTNPPQGALALDTKRWEMRWEVKSQSQSNTTIEHADPSTQTLDAPLSTQTLHAPPHSRRTTTFYSCTHYHILLV